MLASAAVPGTFTRSLSERTWIDQGLITGLATGTHFLLTAVAHDVIDAFADLDITIIDPALEWTVDVNSFRSLGKNSPFHGRRMKGRAVMTFVQGVVKYDGRVARP